jgi:hypothetical protein
VDDTEQLTANVIPVNATNNLKIWSSSNNNIATVSASGLVTAKAPGTADITVTTVDGGFKKTCTVTVTKTLSYVITLTMDEFTMTDAGLGVFNPGSINLDRSDKSTVTVNADGVDVIEWRLGNTNMGTGNSLTLNAVYLEAGPYILNLSFSDGAKTWNGELRFTVTE